MIAIQSAWNVRMAKSAKMAFRALHVRQAASLPWTALRAISAKQALSEARTLKHARLAILGINRTQKGLAAICAPSE